MDIDKQSIVKEFGKNDQDTGATSVQIALLTAKINLLTSHLKENMKDHAARLGLMKSVGQRKRLLNYFKRENREGYRPLIERLGIRK